MRRSDYLALLSLVVLTVLFTVGALKASTPPAEDAAMLLRYAQHLAQGHGIVWNIGDKPIDGATDFLFMVIIAGLVKLGLGVTAAARGLIFTAHLLTVLVVYFALRRLHHAHLWAALFSAAYLALSPARGLIVAGFGAPFFALFVCITWCFAMMLAKAPNSTRLALLFALSGLIAGLIRPEGALLSAFMLVALLYISGLRHSSRTIACFLAVFILLGGAYFLWRWHYFGYPLPNPFYRKGGGHFYFGSLLFSLRNTVRLCTIFLLAFIIGLRDRSARKQTIFVLIPVAGFVAMWVLLSNEMNWLGRFQYAVLPLVLVSWPRLVKWSREGEEPPRFAKVGEGRSGWKIAATAGACALLLVQGFFSSRPQFRPDGRYDVALLLRAYRDRGYTLATTEAGQLPLYSGWRAIDTWGLNDSWIAHNGGITEGYLARYRPELIIFHAYFSPAAPLSEEKRDAWSAMSRTLLDYAQANHYMLAAAYGLAPEDTHYYYVRPDLPEGAEIVREIRGVDYRMRGRQKCTNYAP